MVGIERDREPTMGDLRAGSMSEVAFLREARKRDRKPSRPLWALAGMLAAALVWFNLSFQVRDHANLYYVIGAALGSLLIPGIVVLVAALWADISSPHHKVKVFTVACAVLLVLGVGNLLMTRGYVQRFLNRNLGAEDFKAQAIRCASTRDLACQENNWREFIALQPDDAMAAARLGIILNQRGNYEEAAIHLKHSLDLGTGTYDLFAFYADSQAKLGHTDEAIEWSYKALSVVPNLVDVRGSLASLLLKQKRPYEALSLLLSYDSQLEAKGRPAYFVGQRIAIETVIDQDHGDRLLERTALRLPAYGGHFYAPVGIGSNKPKPFMVDTGASVTSFSETMLRESAAIYRVTQPQVRMTTADGRKIMAQGILLESLKVGPFELKNTPAVVCANCVALLGQASLANFDMQSSRIQGVDFLQLSRRATP